MKQEKIDDRLVHLHVQWLFADRHICRIKLNLSNFSQRSPISVILDYNVLIANELKTEKSYSKKVMRKPPIGACFSVQLYLSLILWKLSKLWESAKG